MLLPLELLQNVFDFLSSSELVAALSTCKRWSTAAIPLLYRSIVVNSRQGRLLARTVAEITSYGVHMRHLFFNYSFDHGDWFADNHATQVLAVAREIETLQIHSLCSETPSGISSELDENRDGLRINWALEESRLVSILQPNGLGLSSFPKLKKCIFRYKDIDNWQLCWDMTKRTAIFLNPAIESLTFIRANHLDNDPQGPLFNYDDRYHATTVLDSLTLEQCDIEADALEKMLSFPKALRHLTYKHFQIWQQTPKFPDVADYAHVLLRQLESLETLHLRSFFDGLLGARFGGLKVLRYLDMELCALFGSGKVSHGNAVPFALNSIPISELLPPALESLVLRYGAVTTEAKDALRLSALRRMLAQKDADLPCLRKLTLLREDRGGGGELPDHVFTGVQGLCHSAGVDLCSGSYQEELGWGFEISKSPP